MCGRYFLDSEAIKDAEDFCELKNSRIPDWRARDIRPSDTAPVLALDKSGLTDLKLQKWGLSGFGEHSLIFNARAETALEKRLFSAAIQNTRAVIPAAFFYEWDEKKQKWTFGREDGRTLFFGGFWKREPDGDRFVILTTEPNESMKPVHDRMPLILERDEIKAWLCTDAFRDILSKKCAELHKKTEYEQLSLF